MPETAFDTAPAFPAPFASAFGSLSVQPAVEVGPDLSVVLVRAESTCTSQSGAVAFLPMAPDAVTIEEAGGGSVPVLKARNHTELDVFVLAGQLIRGGKQNRGINADALIPAKGMIDLPVTCVEQGRWNSGGVRDRFSPAGIEPHFLRSEKMRSVHATKREAMHAMRSAPSEAYFRADQGQVWSRIADYSRSVGRSNRSSDLLETLGGAHDQARAEWTTPLRKAWDGATGMLVFLRGEFLGGDVMGCPEWFDAVREDLLRSAIVSQEFLQSRQGRDGVGLLEELLGERLPIGLGEEDLHRLLQQRLERRRLRGGRPGVESHGNASVNAKARSILVDAMAGAWAVQRGVGCERAWQLEHPFLEAAACVSPAGRPLHLLLGTVRTPAVFMN